MPIVRIDIQEGKSTAYKRALLHGVRRALSFTLGVEDERIMQRIIESPSDNIDAGGVRTDALTIVQVSMLAGHASDVKFKLYEAIVRELRFAPGLVASDIVVHVIDAPPEALCVGALMEGAEASGADAPPADAAGADEPGPEVGEDDEGAEPDAGTPDVGA